MNQNDLTCSFCDGSTLREIFDFGTVALAGAFLKPSQFTEEKKHPLRLHFCEDCYAVQVVDRVEATVLFEDYFYFSSSIGTLREHFRAYASEVYSRFLADHNTRVLEFGCNDGVLLKPLADLGISQVIGVDPAKNVVATINDERITIINDFFTEEVATKVIQNHGKVDLVMANNVFAHIQDIQGTTRAVCEVLKGDGVFIFEVHYLDKVINEMQYDMVYHEHLYYYSLLSAEKHFARYGMVIFDVKEIPIHAGSIRFYVCKSNSKHVHSISESVTAMRRYEITKGYHKYETFLQFASKVHQAKTSLITLLQGIKDQGLKIAGYGASGRANTMIQFCGISTEQIEYIIDDAPAKSGYFTPGSHIPIFSRSILQRTDPPNYILIFAWSFLTEISAKLADYVEKGGKLIIPLPDVKVISREDLFNRSQPRRSAEADI